MRERNGIARREIERRLGKIVGLGRTPNELMVRMTRRSASHNRCQRTEPAANQGWELSLQFGDDFSGASDE
jgi:hypothetical protein